MSEFVHGWGTAAAVAGCSVSMLRRKVDAGELIAHKTEDGLWEFRRGDLLSINGRQSDDDPADPDDQDLPPKETAPTRPASKESPDLVAEAFVLLSGGAEPATLVIELGMTPAQAMQAFEQWKRCTAVADDMLDLMGARELARRLKGLGWTADQVVEAYQQVAVHKDLLATSGYSGDTALELLAEVSAQTEDLDEALRVLRALPRIYELRAEVAASRADLHAVRDDLHHLRLLRRDRLAQLRPLLAFAGWLSTARALHGVVHGEEDAVLALRDALLVLGREEARVIDGMVAKVAPGALAAAEQELAAWASTVLPNHVLVLREEYDRQLRRERERGQAEGMMVHRLVNRPTPP